MVYRGGRQQNWPDFHGWSNYRVRSPNGELRSPGHHVWTGRRDLVCGVLCRQDWANHHGRRDRRVPNPNLQRAYRYHGRPRWRALWFTDFGARAIGRITTAGGITEYPLPTAAGLPSGIAAGSDGSLWFTERYTAKIGRITTAGAITEYFPPANDYSSDAYYITPGPDGESLVHGARHQCDCPHQSDWSSH